MRKLIFLAALALLLWPHAARAGAPPALSVQATPQEGAAPLAVTLVASGDAATYAWDLGDGAAAAGATVQHTYEQAGRYLATVTATGADGQTAQASIQITAYALTLNAPGPVRFGTRAPFRGVLRPAQAKLRVVLRRDGRFVGAALTRANGTFRIRPRVRVPGTYSATYLGVHSNTRIVRVRPRLTVRLAGTPLVGSPLGVVARVRPAAAGAIRITVIRGSRSVYARTSRGSARVALKTAGARVYRIRVRVQEVPGYTFAARSLRVAISMPALGTGSRGPSVRFLEQRLWDLHYALERVDGAYGQDTYDAVLAFQKVNWLPRTGRVDRGMWRRLQHASIPRPRYRGGTHFEVDKARQVLFDVRGGRVARAIHVSTGATGNTPLGVWHVYSKTPGFNSLLMYYSMYFLRGFAIHGYPSVPPYPASHGCVRVPLWIAYSLYETHGYGTTVIVY
jgi:PKD repeat protein